MSASDGVEPLGEQREKGGAKERVGQRERGAIRA